MRTIISCPVFMLPRTESQPTLATLVCCCASAFTQSAKSVVHRAKLPSFRLFIFFALTLTPLPHGCACFVPEPGQNIYLPLSKKKPSGLQNGWVFLLMFGSGPR